MAPPSFPGRRCDEIFTLEELEEAILETTRAVEMTSKDTPDRPSYLSSLSSHLGRRFEWTGDLEDLEKSVSLAEQAIDATPHGHPGQASHLNNMSNLLQRRYKWSGNIEDLDVAISKAKQAVDITVGDEPNLVAYLNSLGTHLYLRFVRTDSIDDLEEAIHYAAQVVNKAPTGSPDRADYFDTLKSLLERHKELTGGMGYSEEVIDDREQNTVQYNTDTSSDITHYWHILSTEVERRSKQKGAVEIATAVAPEKVLFQYDPLPVDDPRVLRLMKVLPGIESAPLVCSMELAAGLPDAQLGNDKAQRCSSGIETVRYEALSYTWGDPTQARHIVLNGCVFGVTQNLDAALRHLRLEDAERTLWVDAICINQTDLKEKEREVTRMCSIYYHCRRVVVWLGEGTADSDVAMDFATQIYKCFSEHPIFFRFDEDSENKDDENFYDWMGMEERVAVVKTLIDVEHISSWISLFRLFSRPWWGRAWILQEVSVPQLVVVCCGKKLKPWSIINMAALVAADAYPMVHELINARPSLQYEWQAHHRNQITNLVQFRESRTQQDPRNTIARQNNKIVVQRAKGVSKCLIANRMRECSFPQDKVFSVLGLLPKAFQQAIQPDYSQSVEKVFTEVAKAYVEISGCLNIICYSHHSRWHPKQYPSWMPDWTKVPRMTVFVDRAPVAVHYDPTLSTKACAAFSDDLSVLTVEGFAVGVVEKAMLEFTLLRDLVKMRGLYPVRDGNEISAERANSYGIPIRTISCPGQSEPSDPTFWYFEESFRELIEPALISPTLAMSDKLNVFLREVQTRRATSNPNASTPESETMSEAAEVEFQAFYSSIQGLLMSRTIFQTREGHLGIGPDFTEPGDFLCLLMGCDAPVILRKRENGSYMFIGDSFVSEFMRGDGMRGLKAGRYSLTKFSMT